MRVASAGLLLAGATLLELSLTASPGSSATAAAATVVNGTGQPITTGGPTTPFSLKLPTGAGCVHNGSTSAQVYGFMVPVGSDVTTMKVVSAALVATSAYNDFTFEDAMGNQWPGVAPGGQVGSVFIIAGLPAWQWSPEFGPKTPPAQNLITGSGGLIDPAGATNAGKWLIGVACTWNNSGQQGDAGDNVWDVEVDFSATGSGTSQSFTWAVNTSGTTTSSSTSSSTTSSTTSTTSTTSTPINLFSIAGSANDEFVCEFHATFPWLPPAGGMGTARRHMALAS
jgi:hypothetical protein